jgi:hypothetical protein
MVVAGSGSIRRCPGVMLALREHHDPATSAPGLRGPRALKELVRLLMSTGGLTADDLRRLPQQAQPD